jgi:nucleotidyltransferase substrate binding protein (TIGR01987 family)
VDRLTQRVDLARRTLAQLDELVGRTPLTPIERDAALQRFEYSCETGWKLAQLYLREREGSIAGAPKQIARSSALSGLLDEDETARALTMVDDRNDTVHTYNEALALDIAARLPDHAALLRAWLQRIEQRLQQPQ